MSETNPDPRLTSRTKQPNSRNCFACGIENEFGLGLKFYELEGDELYAEFIVPDRFEGFPGIVHGGIVASMLDEMLSRAGLIGDHDRLGMTAKLDIRYRAPVPTGELLTLFARVVNRKGRILFSQAELRLPDGKLAAEAKGMMIDIDDETLEGLDLEELGWKVYPDKS